MGEPICRARIGTCSSLAKLPRLFCQKIRPIMQLADLHDRRIITGREDTALLSITGYGVETPGSQGARPMRVSGPPE
jgi:hypothetical protein